MTDRIDLDKLLELEAKATAGPLERSVLGCVIHQPNGRLVGDFIRHEDAEFSLELRNAARPLLLELKRSREALAAAEAFIAEELECRERSYLPEQNGYISSAREVLEKVRRARGGE